MLSYLSRPGLWPLCDIDAGSILNSLFEIIKGSLPQFFILIIIFYSINKMKTSLLVMLILCFSALLFSACGAKVKPLKPSKQSYAKIKKASDEAVAAMKTAYNLDACNVGTDRAQMTCVGKSLEKGKISVDIFANDLNQESASLHVGDCKTALNQLAKEINIVSESMGRQIAATKGSVANLDKTMTAEGEVLAGAVTRIAGVDTKAACK